MRTHSARLAIAAMMVLGAQTVQAQTAPSDPCAGASAGAHPIQTEPHESRHPFQVVPEPLRELTPSAEQ